MARLSQEEPCIHRPSIPPPGGRTTTHPVTTRTYLCKQMTAYVRTDIHVHMSVMMHVAHGNRRTLLWLTWMDMRGPANPSASRAPLLAVCEYKYPISRTEQASVYYCGSQPPRDIPSSRYRGSAVLSTDPGQPMHPVHLLVARCRSHSQSRGPRPTEGCIWQNAKWHRRVDECTFLLSASGALPACVSHLGCLLAPNPCSALLLTLLSRANRWGENPEAKGL